MVPEGARGDPPGEASHTYKLRESAREGQAETLGNAGVRN